LKPTSHPFENSLERVALQTGVLVSLELFHASQYQANAGRASRRKHHFFQAAVIVRKA
jgi:hypothetical protein